MKKLFSLFAAVLFAGSMMAAEATLAKSGDKSYDATVNTKTAIKVGTSSANGAMTITFGAGATKLTFHIAAWSGKAGNVNVSIPGQDAQTLDITADSGISGSGTDYTLSGSEADFVKELTLSNITAETTITLSSGTARRFVVWDATYVTDGTPAEPVVEYYLVGSMNNWTPATGYKLAANAASAGEYVLKTTFAANDQFKVRKVIDGEVDAWYPDGMDNNYTITEAGKYNVYFRPDGQGGEGWHQGCIYAARIMPKTCAEVYNMAKNDEVLLNDLTVTYVNGKNVYVKDASGAMLLYLPDVAEWAAGDVLSGVEGKVDIYSGLYEVKPSAEQVAAVEATAGEAPAPVEMTAAPVAADMNKYVVLKNVSVSAASFPDNKNMDATIGEQTFILRNSFNANIAFDTEKTYDITGVVAVYNDNVQVYFISAEEYVEPVVPADRRINAYGLNVVANGDDYNFSYYVNIAGNEANLLFYKDGVLQGRVAVDDPIQGLNEVTLAKSEIPQGTGLTWAVELKANPVAEFACVHAATAMTGRGQAVINAIPESDYFGYIYYTNRTGSATGGLYVYNPDYTLNGGLNLLGETATWGSQKFSIDATGMLWLPDYTDQGHSGVYVVDPADLTKCSQFYQGTRGTSGLWTNNGIDVGGSSPCAYIHGEGAETKLYTIDEDMPDYANGLMVYNVGQEDGSILHQWNTAPSKKIALQHNAGGVFSIGVTDKAIWLCQNRAKGSNNSAAYSLMAYSHDGVNKYVSDDASFINGSLGGGLVIDKEGLIYIPDGDKNILVLKPTYAADTTVTLEKVATIDCGYSMISSMSFDYAGNLVASVSNSGAYSNSSSMLMAVFAIPTDKNEIIVPAKKALVVEGTDPNPSTAIEDIYVLEVQKVIRNGQVLIIKDGKTYNMMGQIVE